MGEGQGDENVTLSCENDLNQVVAKAAVALFISLFFLVFPSRFRDRNS